MGSIDEGTGIMISEGEECEGISARGVLPFLWDPRAIVTRCLLCCWGKLNKDLMEADEVCVDVRNLSTIMIIWMIWSLLGGGFWHENDLTPSSQPSPQSIIVLRWVYLRFTAQSGPLDCKVQSRSLEVVITSNLPGVVTWNLAVWPMRFGGKERSCQKAPKATKIMRSRRSCFIAFRLMRELWSYWEKELLPILHALA